MFSRQILYIDPNKPNFTQLTSIGEWLNSLGLGDLIGQFVACKYLNLSQVLHLKESDMANELCVNDERRQKIMIDSLDKIQFELSYHSGFLV